MFISKKKLRALINDEIDGAIQQERYLDVVVNTYGSIAPTLVHVVRRTPYSHCIPGSRIKTTDIQLFNRILGALESLGVKLHMESAKEETWNLKVDK